MWKSAQSDSQPKKDKKAKWPNFVSETIWTETNRKVPFPLSRHQCDQKVFEKMAKNLPNWKKIISLQ
jgi:hypothetical protein